MSIGETGSEEGEKIVRDQVIQLLKWRDFAFVGNTLRTVFYFSVACCLQVTKFSCLINQTCGFLSIDTPLLYAAWVAWYSSPVSTLLHFTMTWPPGMTEHFVVFRSSEFTLAGRLTEIMKLRETLALMKTLNSLNIFHATRPIVEVKMWWHLEVGKSSTPYNVKLIHSSNTTHQP